MQPLVLTRKQVRQVDRHAIEVWGISGLVLMENAGRGCADRLEQLGIRGPVAICCGKGNNAGDGFVLARHLDLRGHAVRVLVWAEEDELSGDAGCNFRILQRCGVPIEMFGKSHDPARLERHLHDAAWIVYALLGTGAVGDPRPPVDQVIAQINGSGTPIVAVDLPSGLDCDTGETAKHTVRAAHTFTFVAAKRGFLVPGAEQYTGQVHVLDIGVPRRLIDEVLAG